MDHVTWLRWPLPEIAYTTISHDCKPLKRRPCEPTYMSYIQDILFCKRVLQDLDGAEVVIFFN